MGSESPKPAKKELLKPLIYGGVTTVDIRKVGGKLNESDRGSQTVLNRGVVDRLLRRRSVEEKLFDKKGNLTGFEIKTRTINGDVGTEVALVTEPDLVNGGPDYKKPVLEKVSRFGAASLLVDEFELFEYLKDGEERVRRLKMRTKRDGAKFVTEKNFVDANGKTFPKEIVEKSLKAALLSTKKRDHLTKEKSDGSLKLILGDDNEPIEVYGEVVEYGLQNLLRPKAKEQVVSKITKKTERKPPYFQEAKIITTEILNPGSDAQKITVTTKEMGYTAKGSKSDQRHETQVVEEYGDTDPDKLDPKKKIRKQVLSVSYLPLAKGLKLQTKSFMSFTYDSEGKEQRGPWEESEYTYHEQNGTLERRVDKIDAREVRTNSYTYGPDILMSEDPEAGVMYRCVRTSDAEARKIKLDSKKKEELLEKLGRFEDVTKWKIVGEPIKTDPESFLRSGVTGG